MSSLTFETFQCKHLTYSQWNIHAEYRWDKGGAYAIHVGIFNQEGIQIGHIFSNTYATKESAKRAFKRQVAKIKKGEIQ